MADEDEDVRSTIKELLDAEDDGKLTLEDAKVIAAKMAASARKRIVTLLDEDGDGEISWAEIEGGARGAFHRCEEAVTRAWRVPSDSLATCASCSSDSASLPEDWKRPSRL